MRHLPNDPFYHHHTTTPPHHTTHLPLPHHTTTPYQQEKRRKKEKKIGVPSLSSRPHNPGSHTTRTRSWSSYWVMYSIIVRRLLCKSSTLFLPRQENKESVSNAHLPPAPIQEHSLFHKLLVIRRRNEDLLLVVHGLLGRLQLPR